MIAAVIETKRLALRRLTTEDAGFMLELLNDPDFLRYIGDKKVRTREDACGYIQAGPMQSYAQHGFGLERVELRATGEAVGICGLLKRDWLDAPDLGFAFLPRFRRHGYASEAAAAVLAWARSSLGARRVLAIVDADNAASIGLLSKLGFRQDGRVTPPGETVELLLMAADA